MRYFENIPNWPSITEVQQNLIYSSLGFWSIYLYKYTTSGLHNLHHWVFHVYWLPFNYCALGKALLDTLFTVCNVHRGGSSQPPSYLQSWAEDLQITFICDQENCILYFTHSTSLSSFIKKQITNYWQDGIEFLKPYILTLQPYN